MDACLLCSFWGCFGGDRGTGIFLFLLSMKRALLVDCHLANFLRLSQTWSVPVLPCVPQPPGLAAPMLVTGRQVMAGGHGGCGAQQVFSGAPFHCQLWFHSSAELREAGLSVVGGLSQPFPWPIYSQSLTACGTRDKCWKPGSSLSTAPSACSTTTSKVCWKAGRGGKKPKSGSALL